MEDEVHVLLDCPAYATLRARLFSRIRNLTGDTYRLAGMVDDKQWLVNFMIGKSVNNKQHSALIHRVVAQFLWKAMRQRKVQCEEMRAML